MNKISRILTGLLVWLLMGVLLSPVSFGQAESSCAADAIVQPGDTLSSLAGRYYGNVGVYGRIMEATNAQAGGAGYATIASANLISVGWKLCIPGPLTATAPAATLSVPVVQPTPTALPTPVAPPTPPTLTMTVEEMHPLQIEYMRRHSYPGSELVIEEVLAPGANYNRYLVSYLSEGNRIFALLTVPQGTKPETGWPVVIFNHGYIPPEIYRTTERYIAYTDAFSRAGYIVFKSDYRGHGFSEGEATGGTGSSAYTVDVLNAMGSIKRYREADPDRIVMWGHSMGGQITLRAMVVSKEIKAGVIWAGTVGTYEQMLERQREREIADPNWANRTRRWREELTEQYGSPEENPVFWASISPNSYVADLSGPIQLHHGTADTSVPVAYSEVLNAQIQAVDGDVDYYVYPGDNHNLSVNLGTALARSVAFFDQYVK